MDWEWFVCGFLRCNAGSGSSRRPPAALTLTTACACTAPACLQRRQGRVLEDCHPVHHHGPRRAGQLQLPARHEG
jgi:hypothetical protein